MSLVFQIQLDSNEVDAVMAKNTNEDERSFYDMKIYLNQIMLVGRLINKEFQGVNKQTTSVVDQYVLQITFAGCFNLTTTKKQKKMKHSKNQDRKECWILMCSSEVHQ